MYYFRNLAEAYQKTLMYIKKWGVLVDSPEWKTECLEAMNFGFVILPGDVEEERVSLLGIHTPASLKNYCAELIDGTLDWAVKEGKEAYTYHDRFAEQAETALKLLYEDPETRRATITIRNADDINHDDQPCLTSMSLYIRDDMLHMTCYFRSNDAYKAMYMNIYALRCLQKKWAESLGVGIGEYCHLVGSLHVYASDFPAFNKAVERTEHNSISADEFWEAL